VKHAGGRFRTARPEPRPWTGEGHARRAACALRSSVAATLRLGPFGRVPCLTWIDRRPVSARPGAGRHVNRLPEPSHPQSRTAGRGLSRAPVFRDTAWTTVDGRTGGLTVGRAWVLGEADGRTPPGGRPLLAGPSWPLWAVLETVRRWRAGSGLTRHPRGVIPDLTLTDAAAVFGSPAPAGDAGCRRRRACRRSRSGSTPPGAAGRVATGARDRAAEGRRRRALGRDTRRAFPAGWPDPKHLGRRAPRKPSGDHARAEHHSSGGRAVPPVGMRQASRSAGAREAAGPLTDETKS